MLLMDFIYHFPSVGLWQRSSGERFIVLFEVRKSQNPKNTQRCGNSICIILKGKFSQYSILNTFYSL